jgi:hypothetical protein
MAKSRSLSKRWKKSYLGDFFYSIENDSSLYPHLTITLYIQGLDPSIIENTKEQLRDYDCFIFEAFLSKLWCVILDISSPGDNLYMCNNLCATHDGNLCAYGGFCPHGKSLYDCASTKSMHTTAESIEDSSHKFMRSALNLLRLNIRLACRHLPGGGYKHCPACTDQEREVHTKLNKVSKSSAILLLVNPVTL